MVMVEVTGTRMLMGQMTGTGGSDRGTDGGNDGPWTMNCRMDGPDSYYLYQYLNNDALESCIRFTVQAFPLMRTSLRAVNTLFKATVDKMPCPTVYSRTWRRRYRHKCTKIADAERERE